ncbi:hypothetical protein CRG98_020239 [Punica granatum]|uniref:Uncharacterized protein n=1 Tax=Punica granatum TaxID=22663 RepID=A0A2I0JSY1_PUNGR|nr:hypothetical protein CRG98_020239 [Punica granatum]
MGEVPEQLPGSSGVLLIIFGCILYPSTRPKSGKLSAPHFGPLAPTENPRPKRVTIHDQIDEGEHAGTGTWTTEERRLPNGVLGTPRPRIDKRRPEIGLHRPRDHQDQGAGFRLYFETHHGSRLERTLQKKLGQSRRHPINSVEPVRPTCPHGTRLLEPSLGRACLPALGESTPIRPLVMGHTDHRCRVMHRVTPLRELLSDLFPYNSTGKGLDAEDVSEADTSIDFESTPLQEAPARELPDMIRDEDRETLAISHSRIDRGNLGHPHPWDAAMPHKHTEHEQCFRLSLGSHTDTPNDF